MNIDSKEMSVFEICRSKEDVVATVKKFEEKITGRDHGGDGANDKYDKAFTN
jgi:hypothetical protein